MRLKNDYKSDTNQGMRASIVELFSLETVADTTNSEKIYSRDSDNLYPLRIERIINNSPTARRCSELMARYIIGNGVPDEQDVIVNKKKGLTLNDFADLAASSIATQGGAYFHVKYSLDVDKYSGENSPFVFADIDVLDYTNMAKSKEDDDGFPGKFYVLKYKDGEILEIDKDCQWFYPYNTNKRVIAAQMVHDCELLGITEPTVQDLIRNYRGQVLYLNMTPKYVYALPSVDCVYNDCDTEYRIGVYNNTQTRSGFLGKTQITKFAASDEEEDDFEEDIAEFLGSENAASAYVVEVPTNANITDLTKAFVVNQLKPQFDDKLFETTIKAMRQNIMGAFNNIPEPLVFSSQGSLFGTSADTYNEMKRFYWEQCEKERAALERALYKLGFDISFIPIKGVESEPITTTPNATDTVPQAE